MEHFRLIKKGIPVSDLIGELSFLEDHWDMRRGSAVDVQRETMNIELVKAEYDPSLEEKFRPLKTILYDSFPLLTGFMEIVAKEIDGALSKAIIVSLKPGGRVYPHTDPGQYYAIRDRYHLVLQSEGSIMRSGGEEQVFRTGELWWFDNRALHEAENPSAHPRIHLIFDLLPDR